MTIISRAGDLQQYSFIKQNAHFSLAEKSRVNHTALGIVVTIISSIVGTAIFSTLTSKEDNYWLQFITGFLSVGAAVLASLQTFLRFSDVAEQHKVAALGYETVYHAIDVFLLKYARLDTVALNAVDVLPPDEVEKLRKLEAEALEEYTAITMQVRETSKAAPTIPDKVFNRYKKQVESSRQSVMPAELSPAAAGAESVLAMKLPVKSN